MKRSTLSHSFSNVILMFTESALTLLLRLDPKLRKAAYPLAKQGTVVALRLYLPHVEIFATFSTKGVLLDAQLPIGCQEPDVVINAYSMQVINAITTHDSDSVDKLQMRGAAVHVQQVKQFILQLGFASLIQGLIKKIKGGKDTSKPTEAETADKKHHYKLRIKEQQAHINTLTMKNRELETTVKELQSKQKILIMVVVAALIAMVAVIIASLM